jgi:hypothetical protein
MDDEKMIASIEKLHGEFSQRVKMNLSISRL